MFKENGAIVDRQGNDMGKDGSQHAQTREESTVRWLVQELRTLSNTACPILVSFLLNKFPWFISLRFVGGLGTDELAAAALSTSLCNVAGMSLAWGLTGALTTLASQARGDLQARREKLRGEQSDGSCEDGIGNEQASLLNDGSSRATQEYATISENGLKPADSGKPLLPMVYLYRGIFMQLLFVIPVGLWWIVGIQPFLLYIGQDRSLANMTEEYLRILVPGLWFYSINYALVGWLQAIDMADVPAVAAAVGLSLHIPFNQLFIYTLNGGYLGAAAATSVFQFTVPAFTILYLFATRRGRKRVLDVIAADAIGRKTLSFWGEAKPAVLSLKGIVHYFGLALPGIVIMSEWWASEVAIVLAGQLKPSPELSLGAMTLYQQINIFCFMLPVSWGLAGATRVGNLLGAGDARSANLACRLTVLCAALLSGIMGSVLYLTPHTLFPSFFAPDEHDLVVETSRTITLLSFYVFADGIQGALTGIIKGLGRQALVMPIVIFSYWVVGIPLAYYLTFIQFDGFMCEDNYFCGVVGLVAGTTTGTWLHMLLLAFFVFATTDWEDAAAKARERLLAH